MKKVYKIREAVFSVRETIIIADESLKDLTDNEILKLYKDGDDRIEIENSQFDFMEEEINDNIPASIECINYYSV